MASLVERSDSEGVSVLCLQRPEVLNALSPQLFSELRAHVERIATEVDRVGCVVLRGAGRSFSAGNDLRAIQAGERAPSPHFQAETLDLIERLPQPVIAAVQGHCYTGALELALAADLLIAAESARFADTHGKFGMTPTWGMSQRLPRRIGALRAKELMFSGRVVTGAEAVALGLANACVPDAELESRALGLARQIAGNSWFTLMTEKRLIRDGQSLGLDEALAHERKTSPGAGPDMRERLAKFQNR
ncbi:MAG TPA: enoyl-CoA hydratase/isomerase family protein [Myxococcota bacterium]|nr:enoyl-CoA hydratase/isomerase family protein [Myxococcota bacterium]